MSETICATGDIPSLTQASRSRKHRLMVWSALIIFGIAILAGIETNHWREVERLRQSFAAANLGSFYLGLNCREGVQRMNGALLRFQLSENEEEKQAFQREMLRITENIGQSRRSLRTAEERTLLDELEKAFQHYLEETSPLLERGVRSIRKDTAAQLNRTLAEKAQPVLALAEKLVAAQEAAFNGFFASSHAALGSLQKVLQLSLVLLVLVVFAFGALLYRSVVAPLRLQLSQTQAAIEKQERLVSLGVLAAGVAHEIRNPLTAIKFRLFSLKNSLPLALQENEDVTIIQSEISRLERIVKEFLLFARPSEPQFTLVQVDRLLQETRDLLQPEMQKRGIELHLEPPAETAPLRVDKQQIQQVLINLIQNAADAIGGDGLITLRARTGASSMFKRAQPVLILEVSDTGQGISPEVEKRLFDPFFSTKEGGTGLGLAIAARIVEKHGGFIQYLTQPQRGTTFSVVLPKSPEHESAHSAHRR
jgi:signal transduction histidine kinase